jgi:hypothetical protein
MYFKNIISKETYKNGNKIINNLKTLYYIGAKQKKTTQLC